MATLTGSKRRRQTTLRRGRTRTKERRTDIDIFDSWEGLVFLIRKADHKGERKFYVRIVFGELAPFIDGPYDDRQSAEEKFQGVRDGLDVRLYDLVYDYARDQEL